MTKCVGIQHLPWNRVMNSENPFINIVPGCRMGHLFGNARERNPHRRFWICLLFLKLLGGEMNWIPRLWKTPRGACSEIRTTWVTTAFRREASMELAGESAREAGREVFKGIMAVFIGTENWFPCKGSSGLLCGRENSLTALQKASENSGAGLQIRWFYKYI